MEKLKAVVLIPVVLLTTIIGVIPAAIVLIWESLSRLRYRITGKY